MSDDLTMPTLEQQLCFAVHSANLAYHRTYKDLLKDSGLTYPQFLVLVVLWQDAPLTVQGLGKRMFLESNTLTPLLKRMEQRGWVSRTRDPADERRVLIELTDAGHALQRDLQHVPGCTLQRGGLTLEALEDLRGRLHRLRDQLLANTGR